MGMIDEVKRYAAYDVLYLCPLVEMLEKQINKASVNMATKLCNQHASLDEEAQESAEQYLSFSQDFQAYHTEQPVQEPMPPLPAFMANNESLNDEDLELLLLQLPNAFAEFVRNVIQEVNLPLLEIKLDAGRPPILLFAGEPERVYEDYKPLPIIPIVKGFAAFCGIAESDYPSLFTSDNRMGLASTLHRISCLKSRHGEIIGLTLRIGRHVPSVVGLVLDLVQRVAFEQRNLLLLGAPGKGKTTLLRSVIQALNLYFQRRVIVVDTSNEIAGDGVVPHPSIGYARRMHVPDRARQHSVLIEAVQNHNPQVIVVDEIGTPHETRAAATIVQRGVAMVGTAHGRDLVSLLHNPELDLLVGGHETLIIGDEEMRMRAKQTGLPKQKLIHQRKIEPIFGQVIEILDWNSYKIYPNTADAVDALLGAKPPCTVEYRSRSADGWTSRTEKYPPKLKENLTTSFQMEKLFRV